MKLSIKGSTGTAVRWCAVPGKGETIYPRSILRAFGPLACGKSIVIADLLNGSFDLVFPEGIDETVRNELFSAISIECVREPPEHCSHPKGTNP